jgi:hypothetical protein
VVFEGNSAMIDYDKMTKTLVSTLAMVFPDFPAEVKPDYEDELIISVNLFAVPSEALNEVKHKVYSLCDSLLEGTGYLAGIVVRDIERTRLYYPEFLPPSPPLALAQVMFQQELLTERGYSQANHYMSQATYEYAQISGDDFAQAA